MSKIVCAKCGKELGLLSTKHKSEDGSIMCGSCFEKWEVEQAKIKEKTMTDFLSRYIADKDEVVWGHVVGLNQLKSVDIKEHWNDYSLDGVRELYQNMLTIVESQKKSGLTSHEIDELISTKETAKGMLELLDDLEKTFKLFEKKGIDTNYSEILYHLSAIIENRMNNDIEREVTVPLHKRISKKLGNDVSKENVIREFMKSPVELDYDGDIDTAWCYISSILDKFNLEYNREEVEQLIIKIKDEFDLEDFEKNLGAQKKINLGGFSELNGYQFEGYLKNLFELLEYTVIETPLSGDQGADLILSKEGEKIVVQAKKYEGKIPNNAIQEIVAAKNHYNADKAMVVTNSSFTQSATELALSNNVELWDGEKLQDKIKSLENKRKEKGLSVTTEHTIDGEKDIQKMKGLCPVCEEAFEYEMDISKKPETIEMNCPNCGGTISANMNYVQSWRCEYCSEEFHTKEETEKHEETCKFRKK